MTDLSRGTAGSADHTLLPSSLAGVEACNALRAERFHMLPDDIPLWRFREVLTQLGAALGLSGGAVVYALDLMGLLTEADWRGDGRAVTFHSVRGYARKVGRSERTICGYERQLIAAGLVHRTHKHARRHGGYGDERRRTGLDWRSFGARMPELLAMLDARRAEEARRLDLETRIRAERRLVQGLAEGMGQGRAAVVAERLAALHVLRLRGDASVRELEARLLALTLMRDELTAALPSDLRAPVENHCPSTDPSDRSEKIDRPIDDTPESSCPKDIRWRTSTRRRSTHQPTDGTDGQDGIGKDKTKSMTSAIAPARQPDRDAIPLEKIWQAAPESWKRSLGPEEPISWPVLIDLADRLAPRLEVSPWAWTRALQVLGPCDAATALLVLDRNRDHPARPVHSVGGALVGMVRRAEAGGFDLAPSVHGVMGRTGGGQGARLRENANLAM